MAAGAGALAVEVVDALQQLCKADACILLIVGASLKDCVQQLASMKQLGDQVHLRSQQSRWGL